MLGVARRRWPEPSRQEVPHQTRPEGLPQTETEARYIGGPYHPMGGWPRKPLQPAFRRVVVRDGRLKNSAGSTCRTSANFPMISNPT
jgi:hypothetical protein